MIHNKLVSVKGSTKKTNKKTEVVEEVTFISDYVCLLYYNRHKINLDESWWTMGSPCYIKIKKAIINPIRKKKKCFKYAVTVSLNHKEIKKDQQ